jgi:Cu/Zn superoxide dismutase
MSEDGICIMTPPFSSIKKTSPYGIILFKRINTHSFSIQGMWKHLKPGYHGFHIHTYGDLSNGCDSLCSHYNPTNQTHGGLTTNKRHLGDYGNILVKKDGTAEFSFIETRCTLDELYGRSFVLHEEKDDLGKGKYEDSKTTGHSGKRILCGIIARKPKS